MFLATENDYAESFGTLGQNGAGLEGVKFTPTAGEYFSAQTSRAFDYTSGMRFYEWMRIKDAEFAANPRHASFKRFDTEEQYQASELYRRGIAFEPGMSEVKAAILAANYDQRRERERILQAGSENGPWWYGPIGFGAGLIGSLPDPINLIPFGGGAVTGAKLAGMTARQVAMNSLRKGVIEGAASNLVSSAFAAYDLNQKGELITMQDVLLDTTFGAVAGPLFHGAGSFISRSMARSSMRGSLGELHGVFTEGHELAGIREGINKGDAGAFARYGDALEKMGVGPEKLQDFTEFIRNRATPEERLDLARAMEFALHDLVDGKAVDVSPMKESIGKVYDRVLNDPTGGPADEVLAALKSPEFERILLERGPAFFAEDGHLIFSGKYIQDTTGYPRSGGGLVKIIWKHGEKSKEAPHLRVTREDIMRLPEILDGHEPIHRSRGRLEWAVNNENGTSLIAVVGKQKGKSSEALITVYRNDNPRRQLSKKRETPASPGGYKSPIEDRFTGTGDTAAEASSNRVQQGQGLSKERIPPSIEQVNRAENYAASAGLDGLRDGGHASPEMRESFAQDLRTLLYLSQERFNSFTALIEGA
jgi:hypothetical protein